MEIVYSRSMLVAGRGDGAGGDRGVSGKGYQGRLVVRIPMIATSGQDRSGQSEEDSGKLHVDVVDAENSRARVGCNETMLMSVE